MSARSERRTTRRRGFYECSWLRSARLRHGPDITVLNLSEAGVLVEGRARLHPGASVEVQFSAPGWLACVPAQVLRCQVSAVVPEHGVRYRAALGFLERIALPSRLDEANGEDAAVGSGRTTGGRNAGSNFPVATNELPVGKQLPKRHPGEAH